MKSFLLFSSLVVAIFFPAGRALAQESYPEVHEEPIRIHFLSGQDGLPTAHLHVLLIAGYERDDLKKGIWQEEAATDADGNLELPRTLVNFPWLRVLPAKAKACLSKPDLRSFSIERMRNEGLSAPNYCGTSSSLDKPGVFNFYVQGTIETAKK